MITRRRMLGLSACIPALPVFRHLSGISKTVPVSTGDPELDKLLGGGYQRSRIIQIFNSAVGCWLLPMFSTEVALQNGQRVTWVAQRKQMVDVFAETVGYKIDGVQLRLVEDLESALRATAEAAGGSDLVVVFAALSELPGRSAEPPCRQVRRLSRAVREAEAAVLIVTDGGEAQCESTQAGRAIRFYAATRIRVDRDFFGDDYEAAVVKNKGYGM
jgi:hypothetical protein